MSTTSLGFLRVKVLALAVEEAERASAFYGGTLGLMPALEGGEPVGFRLGDTILMLKPAADWYGRPTQEPAPRITIEVESAAATERALRARGVRISDPVRDYDGHPVGAFLDSEGNKLWFCSVP